MYRRNGYCALHLFNDLDFRILTQSQLAASLVTFALHLTSGNFLSIRNQPRERSQLNDITSRDTTTRPPTAAVA